MMKRTWFLPLIVLTLALVLVACGGGTEDGAQENGDVSPAEIGDVEAGRELFESGGPGTACITCHTLDGGELVGPTMQGISERADDRDSDLSATEYLRESILEPSAHIVEGYEDLMPDEYDDLSEQELDNLVAFLMTQ